MRVTQSMIASNSLRNIHTSYGKMATMLEQMSSGKKIAKPSDDPVIAQKGMYYRSNLNEVTQYKRNLSEVYLWMDNAEAGMEQANSNLQRIRELVVQAANDTNTDVDREAIAKEINQLKADLVSVANTQVAGRYIFNGTNVTEAPVAMDEAGHVTVNAADSAYLVEVSRGSQLKANANLNALLGQSMFDTISQISAEMTADDPDLDSLLADLDGHISSFSAERSDLGARYNRLELLQSRINYQEELATKAMSDNEDIDLEKIITDYTNQKAVHEAALTVGANLIQRSLVDFLR